MMLKAMMPKFTTMMSRRMAQKTKKTDEDLSSTTWKQ